MLLSDFSESWQLFYADEARLASFKGNEATPSMRTIRINVPEKQLSQERISTLESLTFAFGRQVDRFLQLLTMVDYRRFCIGDRYRKLRDHIVEVGADGIGKELIDRAERKRSRKHRDRIEKVATKKGGVYLPPKVEPLFSLPLQARHWKLALQQSAGIVERWWRLIQTEAAAEIRKRDRWDNFNEPERHYVARMLCSVTDEFFDVLEGKVPFLNIAGVTQIRSARGLCALIQRSVAEVQGRAPRMRQFRSVWFDEGCYSSTYYQYKDETVISLATQEASKRLELTIPGRFPAREFCVANDPKDSQKIKRVTVKHQRKPTIQTVKTDTGWEIHVAIPCKTPEPKLDPSVRRVLSYRLKFPAQKVPTRTALPSDWYDANQYVATYDFAKKETIITFLSGQGFARFEAVFDGELSIVDRRLTKGGKLVDIKQKHKPAIHILRGRKGVSRLEVLGDPIPMGQKVLEGPQNFLRLFRSDVISINGTTGMDDNTESSCWFDGRVYSVLFDEATNQTSITVNRPRNGLRFTVVVPGRPPMREVVVGKDGKKTVLDHPKKPSFRIVKMDNVKAQLEILLPVKPVSIESENAINVSRANVVSYSKGYLDVFTRSDWFGPEEYRATFDEKSQHTIVAINPSSGIEGFTFAIENHAYFADRIMRIDGTEKDVKVQNRPYLNLSYVGKDAEGKRMIEVIICQSNPSQTPNYLKPDEVLFDPNKVRIMGFDFGFTEVAYDALGNCFGANLGKIITRFVNYLVRIGRIHNIFRSLVHKHSAHGTHPNPAKAKRIIKNNLGQKTFNKRKTALRDQIRNEINHAINEMLKLHKGTVFIIEAFSQMFSMARVSKYWRRLLTSWVRGELVERLEFKAGLAGVRLVYMPTSYSSQVCNVCGDRHHRNRHGNDFICRKCHTHAHADIKAAEQLMLRLHDQRFHRYISGKEIRACHRADRKDYCKKNHLTR